jgi:hypothetical protein
MIAMLLLLLDAEAGAIVLSASGGFDGPTAQPWTGLELALHPTHDHGVAPIGRIVPAFGFGDREPMVFSEFGLAVVLPNEEAIVRLGAVVRPVWMYSHAPMPIEFAPPSAERQTPGVNLGGMALIEFEWGQEAPFTVGFKGGFGSSGSDIVCGPSDVDPAACITWHPGFIGGFMSRARLKNGLSAEVMLGPLTSLSVGFEL